MKQTHVGQTVLFYAPKGNAIGEDEVPAIITRAWSVTCVDLEIITGPFKGCAFTSIDNTRLASPGNAMWRMLDDIEAIETVPEQTQAAADDSATPNPSNLGQSYE